MIRDSRFIRELSGRRAAYRMAQYRRANELADLPLYGELSAPYRISGSTVIFMGIDPTYIYAYPSADEIEAWHSRRGHGTLQ